MGNSGKPGPVEPYKQAAYDLGRRLAKKNTTTTATRRITRVTQYGVEIIEEEVIIEDNGG